MFFVLNQVYSEGFLYSNLKARAADPLAVSLASGAQFPQPHISNLTCQANDHKLKVPS